MVLIIQEYKVYKSNKFKLTKITVCFYPTHLPHGHDVTQGELFKQSTAGLNSEFFLLLVT